MRKIKKFKIPIYSYDILRKAKKHKIDLFALGLAAQESAKEYISSIASAVEPSTVFDYIGPEDPLAEGSGPFPGGCRTVGVITLGPAFEGKLKAIQDPELMRLAETAALVFSDTGLKIISELIAQETGMDGFDPGPAEYLTVYPPPESDKPLPEHTAPEDISGVLARLQADKIGVAYCDGAFAPRYSGLFVIPWLTRKKKKSAAGASAPKK